MSRIDDALRRSGKAVLPRAEGAPAADDVFTSPWAFRDGVKPVAAPVVRQEPADTAEVAPAQPEPVDTGLSGAELRPIRGFSDAWMERLVISPSADPLLVEQFRELAATLHQARADHNTRVVMVTSASAGEGKSLTVVNLALTLSDSYRQRVLLIDADLRRPSLHEVAHVPGNRGLGDTLKSPVEQKLPVYQLSETLMLVPAGPPDPDPMRALTSSRMQQILQEAASRFDWVLIDAPPVGPIVDSTLLAPNIDAAIMVVRAGKTSYAEVKRAIDELGRERIIGVVLNGTDEVQRGVYHRYYHASEPGPTN